MVELFAFDPIRVAALVGLITYGSLVRLGRWRGRTCTRPLPMRHPSGRRARVAGAHPEEREGRRGLRALHSRGGAEERAHRHGGNGGHPGARERDVQGLLLMAREAEHTSGAFCLARQGNERLVRPTEGRFGWGAVGAAAISAASPPAALRFPLPGA